MGEAATMREATSTVIEEDARRIGGMSEKGNGRDRNDGRGLSDNRRRCKDEGGRSTCVRFGIRVGTVGFRKKKSHNICPFSKK